MRVSRTNMCHHVMLRGIDGRPVFMDDSDRNRFCLLVQEASELCFFRVHAFCLMTNHIHLILEPTTGSLSIGVHRFSSRYAQHFNKRHRLRGYVFQGRFRSILVEDGNYLRRLVRYIHLNPVDAKIIGRPEQYPWSSHNAYFNRATYAWLHTDRVLSHFGNTRTEALANMVIHFETKMDAELDIKEIESAFRKGVYGSEEFAKIYVDSDNMHFVKNELEQVIVNNIEQLVETVSMQFNVTIDELRSADKRRELVTARAILARAAQLARGVSLKDVCEILGKHHGTVSRLASLACKDKILNDIANQFAKVLL